METNTTANGDSLKVLVLEDSALDFEVICEQLNDADISLKVSWVQTEEAFISSIRENQYDIIISDFKLPGFDAFGALRISNEICPEVPFICLSGYIGEETAIELLKLGAVDYVLKDRPERLPFAVKRAIEEAKGEKLRRKAQEELLFNYAMLRIAGRTAKVGGWSVDLITNIEIWSDVVADIHEMPHDYMPGVTEAIGLYAPEYRERVTQVFTDCAEKGIPYDEEMEIITPTGRRVWVRTTGEAVKNDDGKIIKVQGSFQDITDRKQRINALQVANMKLEESQRATFSILEDLKAEVLTRRAKEAELQKVTMAIEQAGEAIVITDPAGKIEYVNPAFETVSGYSGEEVIGKTPAIHKSDQQDHSFYHELWKTIASGQVWQGRLVNKHKDGRLYTEESTISPVFDAARKIINYVGVKRDITAHLELAAQLEQAQKMESVGRLAGGIAHDYNNMLSVILGYTELAMEKVDPSDQLYEDLHEVFDAAKRSTEITRQLLTFARKQTIAPELLDLNTTLDGMLNMLRRLIGEDIILAWMPAFQVWPISIDPTQMDQILANLCVNARDAIHGVGKITIETANVSFDEVYCSMHSGFIPGEFVMLAVSDNGCGIDKDTLGQIFDPFFTTKEVGEGTGLGLATVYGIMKQNGGFINVSSEPNIGTTFKIFLPRDTVGIEKAKDTKSSKPLLGRGETILLVEDESALLTMTNRLLERLGYNVFIAAGPDEALRLAEAHGDQIDLLLTDVIMPKMNGRDLANQVATLYPNMKHLFMSGYTADVIARQGVLDKSVNFIQKPLGKNDLAAKVRKVLDTA